MDITTRQFSRYAAALSYRDLTSKAIHEAKRCLVDSIGCALGAFHVAPVPAIRALASEVTASQPATLIGTCIRSSAELASFVNGTMIRCLDYSDDYFGVRERQPGPHPSDNIASVLATVESEGGDGRTLILGIALAYEICNQLVDHAILHAARGWDHPIMHAIATALAAGKVMGLSEAQLGHAVGLAVVPNICLRQTRSGELSNWKGMAGPNGCRNGYFAAQLARNNITGPAQPFEGNAGFMKQLNTPFRIGPMGGGDTPFKIETTYFKYMPVMYALQLPIWAALELRKKVRIEDVRSITCYVDAFLAGGEVFSAERWTPMTRETADHSGPYLIGAALVDGAISAETMTRARYADPAILALTAKIRVEEDPVYTAAFPGLWKCRLEATLASGAVVTVEHTNPKGHALNPLSDAELETKFMQLAGPVLGDTRCRGLLECLWQVEQLSEMHSLMELMVVNN
jgi:2-methylcitrate dehydratase